MNEIFLISSHPNSEIQKKYLRELVDKLNNDGRKIMVTAHMSIPKDVEEKCEYTFYSKKNQLLTDNIYKGYLSMSHPDFHVASKNFFKYNSILAIYNLILPSLVICKMEGYDVVHMVEYDTLVDNMMEFDNNMMILNDGNGVVMYDKGDSNFFLAGEIISFNMNHFSINDLIFTDDQLKAHIQKHVMGEDSTYNLLLSNKQIYIKHINDLIGIRTGLHHTDPSPITMITIYGDMVYAFSYNQSSNSQTLTIVYNNGSLNHIIPSDGWLYALLGKITDVKFTDIYIDKTLFISHVLDNNGVDAVKRENIIKYINYDESKVINSNFIL